VLAAVVYSSPVEDDWIETSHPAKDNVNVRDVLMSDTSTDEEFKAAVMIAIDNFKVPDDEVFLRAAHIVAHERFSDDTALGRMLIENQLPGTAAAAAAMAKEIKAALVKVKQIFLEKCKDLVEFLLKGMKAAWEAIKLALKQATFTLVKGLYCAFCEASILFMITCAAASGGPFTQAVIGAIPTVSWAAGMVKTGAGAAEAHLPHRRVLHYTYRPPQHIPRRTFVCELLMGTPRGTSVPPSRIKARASWASQRRPTRSRTKRRSSRMRRQRPTS